MVREMRRSMSTDREATYVLVFVEDVQSFDAGHCVDVL
jgi:hypothetical protein